MLRISPTYSNIRNLEVLDSEDLQTIELKAKSMNLTGCLDFLCLDEADLGPIDLKFANIAWKRGRAEGISIAAERMFSAMQAKGGGQVALEYLRHLSDTFKVSADDLSNQGPNSGFTFNVTMD